MAICAQKGENPCAKEAKRMTSAWWILLPALALGLGRGDSGARSMSFRDDFETGLREVWQFPFPEDWEIRTEAGNHYLHMKRSREPGVPRRPLQFALLKVPRVGSFEFQARVRREGRSMIIVFNHVDTLHFYYAHLSADRGVDEPVHNGIFIVDGGPRRRIAGTEAPPALPDRAWHQVRLVRNVSSGAIEVYIDGANEPTFRVVDHTFTCGQVGIGSFDETGDFDSVELDSDDADCEPEALIRHASGN